MKNISLFNSVQIILSARYARRIFFHGISFIGLYINSNPTGPFTILEPCDQEIGDFCAVRKRRARDVEGPKLRKSRSGAILERKVEWRNGIQLFQQEKGKWRKKSLPSRCVRCSICRHFFKRRSSPSGNTGRKLSHTFLMQRRPRTNWKCAALRHLTFEKINYFLFTVIQSIKRTNKWIIQWEINKAAQYLGPVQIEAWLFTNEVSQNLSCISDWLVKVHKNRIGAAIKPPRSSNIEKFRKQWKLGPRLLLLLLLYCRSLFSTAKVLLPFNTCLI